MRRLLLCLFLLAAVTPLAAAPNAYQQARSAAEAHYGALTAGDRRGWGQTFAREHGDLAALWLSGTDATRAGYRYTFGKSNTIADSEISLMFTKRDAKGKPIGGSPITLILEDGKWKVTSVSY